MLNARAIYKLLLDDELPPTEPSPSDPLNPDDTASAERELSRYVAASEFLVRGVPVDLYDRWKHMLNGRRKRALPKVRATWLEDIDGMIVLMLHQTDLIRVDHANNVIVNMGEWASAVTRDRINWAQPGGWLLFGVEQPRQPNISQRYTFHWYNPETNQGNGGDNKRLPFTNGDTIKGDGTLLLQAKPEYWI